MNNDVNLLKAAGSALRSYQHGNASPDLAKDIADKIDAATVWWDPRYRLLKEGETIEEGDEVLTEASLGWRPAGHTVGGRAPSPHYTAHRIYRRRAPAIFGWLGYDEGHHEWFWSPTAPPAEKTLTNVREATVIEKTMFGLHGRAGTDGMFLFRFEAAPAPRRWRHKKRGSTYTEIGRGALQISGILLPHESADLDKHIEASIVDGLDMTPVVIYRADEDGSWWARPIAEFEDGRFEEVL